MKKDLSDRVALFNSIKLSEKLPMIHMGTSYLINDLYKEVRRLEELVEKNKRLAKWLVKENKQLKEFLKLIYENRFEIDKLYLYAERTKEYFAEEE